MSAACPKHNTGGGPCYCSGSVYEPITVFSAAARRLWIAEQADYCAKWLKAQGLEVLRVEKGPLTQPRIIIRPSPLCDRFDGAVSGYSRTLKGELRYRWVMRFDCEVRWDAMDSHARFEVQQERAYKARSLFRRLAAAIGCATGGAA